MPKTTLKSFENKLETAHILGSGYTGREKQDFLLFIASVENLSLKALNFRSRQYFKKLYDICDGKSFFHSVIHPEDYVEFQHFLKAKAENFLSRDHTINIRIKSPFGYWKKFEFEARTYGGLKVENELQIIILARPVEPSSFHLRKGIVIDSEKSLRDSLNRYRTLVNSLDQAFGVVEMIFDLNNSPFDYYFVEANPVFEDIIGTNRILGSTHNEIFKEGAGQWFKTLEKVASTGEAVRFEDFVAVFNRWFDVYVFPIGDRRSQKIACLFSDITQSKMHQKQLQKVNELLEQKVNKSTRELQENNELLQMVFNTVNEGIFVLKPRYDKNQNLEDFTYIRVNRLVNRYYKQVEMKGRSFLELNPFAVEKGILKNFAHTMLSGQAAEFDITFELNTRISWFKITATRQRGLLICTLKNITSEKLRTQKLKENILFKKQLLETSPDAIVITNVVEKKIRYCNQEGLSSQNKWEGMTFLNILQLVHPQDRQNIIDFHSQILQAANKEVLETEFRLQNEQQKWEYYNCRGKIFRRDKLGSVSECIILLQNVQAQKITQQALINAEKLSIKGEIARNLAHELRNPLAAIGMSSEILDTKFTKEDKRNFGKFVAIIKRSTAALNKLVTDLITSSNYSSPHLQKCCLSSLLNTVLAQVEDRLFLAGIKVEKKSYQSQYIWADEERLHIAFLNIIVNACEAMKANKGVLTIDIKRKKEEFIVSIRDNGCGMEPHQLEHLFESFYTNKAKGMGIGLSSVKNIIDEHNASIEVESVLQAGTTFKLHFPVYKEVQQEY